MTTQLATLLGALCVGAFYIGYQTAKLTNGLAVSFGPLDIAIIASLSVAIWGSVGGAVWQSKT